jgi:hypothetical protein
LAEHDRPRSRKRSEEVPPDPLRAAGSATEREDEKREKASEQVKAAGRKAGEASHGRKRRLQGEPNPES